MNLSVYNQKGTKTKDSVEVLDSVFDTGVNHKLLAQYVYVYLSNQREAVAHAKDRSEVRGGGRKPWRQKGTGRARHGSNRSPIWSGGGVTFGPTKFRNWKKNLNKKMKRRAIAVALTRLVREDKLKVVDNVEFKPEQLTKQGVELLKAFGDPRKILIITDKLRQELVNSFANISNVKVALVSEINAYDLANSGEVIILKEALPYTEHWK